MKTTFKLPLILAAYTVVACVGLAVVNSVTEPIIKATESKQVSSSLREIFPDADDFEDVTGKVESGSASIVFDRAFVAKKGGAVSGMVIKVTGPTYSSATLLVGVDMKRSITAVKFTALTDTPGLGMKAADEPFRGQFSSKSVDDAFNVGSDVQAISGATITSRGVANILKLAGYKAGEYLAENFGGAAGTGKVPVLARTEPMDAASSLSDIWPGATFEDITGSIPDTIGATTIFTGEWLVKKGEKVAGVAIQVKGQTYQASTILVGINADRTVAGIRMNASTDSKNIGYPAMLSDDFTSRFAGKSVDASFLVKSEELGTEGELDAVSGATVSMMGVANMVKIAGFEGSRYLAEKYDGKAGPAGNAASSGTFSLNVIPEQE